MANASIETTLDVELPIEHEIAKVFRKHLRECLTWSIDSLDIPVTSFLGC